MLNTESLLLISWNHQLIFPPIFRIFRAHTHSSQLTYQNGNNFPPVSCVTDRDYKHPRPIIPVSHAYIYIGDIYIYHIWRGFISNSIRIESVLKQKKIRKFGKTNNHKRPNKIGEKKMVRAYSVCCHFGFNSVLCRGRIIFWVEVVRCSVKWYCNDPVGVRFLYPHLLYIYVYIYIVYMCTHIFNVKG